MSNADTYRVDELQCPRCGSTSRDSEFVVRQAGADLIVQYLCSGCSSLTVVPSIREREEADARYRAVMGKL